MNLETVKTTATDLATRAWAALVLVARWTWTVHVTLARWTWAALVAVAGPTWTATKWTGRVLLWFLFWPLGLWRSWRHGEDRRNRKAAEAIVAAQARADQDRNAA